MPLFNPTVPVLYTATGVNFFRPGSSTPFLEASDAGSTETLTVRRLVADYSGIFAALQTTSVGATFAGAGLQDTVATRNINGTSSQRVLQNTGATATTTDATVTTLMNIAATASRTTYIDVWVTAIRSTLAEGAAYRIRAAFRNNAGTVTQIGASFIDVMEDVAGWNAIVDINGTNIRVRVTGAAATTVNWACVADVQTVV